MRPRTGSKPSKPKLKISEAALERTCTDFLALDGWRSLKTDPVRTREWGKGFGEIGMADHLYIRYCFFDDLRVQYRNAVSEVMWIEWKRPKREGGKNKAHQKTWQTAERARGALVLVAGEDFEADYDSFVAWYRKSGLLRRQGL